MRPSAWLFGLALSVPPLLPLASAAEPILYAAWHAPYGEPGAADTLTGRCDDTGADTLCLSFDPGEDIETFYALSATVAFHSLPTDTLGVRWWFGGGSGNAFNLRVEINVDSTTSTNNPWGMTPVGGMRYNRTPGHGYLRLVYAQSAKHPTRLERGKRYWLGRVRIPHPPPGVPLCDQPMCVELASLQITTSVATGARELEGARGPDRLVALNARNSRVCDLYRGPVRPPAWMPWKK
jgi:hypothetical protein